MIERLKQRILKQMLPYLNNAQLKQLEVTLDSSFIGIRIEEAGASVPQAPQGDALDSFLAAKRIEDVAENALRYYAAPSKRRYPPFNIRRRRLPQRICGTF